MSNYIIIGLSTEGPTDIRFFESIIQRTYDDVAFECRGEIDTNITIIPINKKNLSFEEQVKAVASIGHTKLGISILCIHTDADDSTEDNIFEHKIRPALEQINNLDGATYCKNIVPIIPVYMTESWMLADKELFKKQLGTTLSDEDLGINRNPENIPRPKEIIEEAIRIAMQERRRRARNNLSISDLYQPIGQQIQLEVLETLPSYNIFKERVIESFRKMGLHD